MSGVRSSCDASATNRRSRSSDAVRSAKACSIWPSIALSATPSRPTSVVSSAGSTRLRQVAGRDRARGLACICSSGRRPSLITSHASTAERSEHARRRRSARRTSRWLQRVVDVVERDRDDQQRAELADRRRPTRTAATRYVRVVNGRPMSPTLTSRGQVGGFVVGRARCGRVLDAARRRRAARRTCRRAAVPCRVGPSTELAGHQSCGDVERAMRAARRRGRSGTACCSRYVTHARDRRARLLRARRARSAAACAASPAQFSGGVRSV